MGIMPSMHSVEDFRIIEKLGSRQPYSRPCNRYAVAEVVNSPYLFSFFRGNTGFRQSLISLAISPIFGRQQVLIIVHDTLIVGNRVVADEAVNGLLTRRYKLELAPLHFLLKQPKFYLRHLAAIEFVFSCSVADDVVTIHI